MDFCPVPFLQTLNKLCPIYHTHFGIHPDKNRNSIWHNIGQRETSRDFDSMVEKSWQTVPHKVVIVKYTDRSYLFDPPKKEWYNEPTSSWKQGSYPPYLRPYILPELDSRP